MVELQGPPRAQQSSLLLLPSEVRNKIWFLLFADSNVVYNKCLYDADLSTERYQVVHSCRFTYLDAFTLLWSHTKITYLDCIPRPSFFGMKEQLTASAPCRKLITRLEFELGSTAAWQLHDLRGLRYFAPLKEVSIGPIILDAHAINHVRAAGLDYSNIDNAGADDLLHEALIKWLPGSEWYCYGHHNNSRLLGACVRNLMLRRNRKYRLYLKFIILFREPTFMLTPGRRKRIVSAEFHWSSLEHMR
jgi:hypothetical protein